MAEQAGTLWIVYILQCADDTLYTGVTNDLELRVRKHEDGKGAKYTRGRGPYRILFSEQHPTKSAALKREAEIKSFSKSEKLKLFS
jgi:putative endonuclease